MTGFRNQKWDPWLIISQIVAIQAIYYFGFGFWILFITLTIDRSPSLDYFFSYNTLQLSNWNGRFFSLIFILNAFTGALAIFYLVGRYKQCLDFSITVHFYHFIACCIYNYQYPNIFSWYVLQFLSIMIMTIISERFSKRYELQNIPLSTRTDL